jgi:phosphoglycerate dehydrogenase-like enzyme
MKRTGFIVNTARGGMIDEKAAYDALKANQIAGAALDVFDQEPTPRDNPLPTLPNFIAGPHVAGVTPERSTAWVCRRREHPERARRQADPRQRRQQRSLHLTRLDFLLRAGRGRAV